MPDAKPMPLIIRVRKAQKFLELVQPTMQTDEVMYAIFQEAMANLSRAGLVHASRLCRPLFLASTPHVPGACDRA